MQLPGAGLGVGQVSIAKWVSFRLPSPPVEDAQRLHDAGILYAPDFAVNRGGVVNAAQEIDFIEPNSVMALVDRTYQDLREIFASAGDGELPTESAEALARARARVPHPLYGHLGARRLAAYRAERAEFFGGSSRE